MNPLLEWGLANSDPEKLKEMLSSEASIEASRKKIMENREFLEALLKPDSERMKDELIVAMDVEKKLEDREIALDNLELLIETVDGANNFAKINGIPQMITLLKDPAPTIQLHAVWVLGTCSQNNARFVIELLKQNGVEAIVTLLSESRNQEVISRTIYALSGCMRAFVGATRKFMELNAFQTLLDIFSGDLSNLNIQRKIAFSLSGIISEQSNFDNLMDHLLERKLLETMVNTLIATDDPELTEKIIEVINATVSASPNAIQIASDSEMKAALEQWAKKSIPRADLPQDTKASFQKTLAAIGVTFSSSV